MLSCDNLSCIKNDQPIFSSLGVTIGDGTVLTLKGPNGSGKTSLLRIMAGLSAPSLGTVLWYKIPITHDYQDYLRDMLYLGHKNPLNLHMTVKENMMLWSKLRFSQEMLDAAIFYFGLGDKLTLPCHLLSQGWQKRVALARFMSVNAKLWLMDEPFTFLDEEGKDVLSKLITSRISQGGIVVLSSNTDITLSQSCVLDVSDFKETVC